MSDDFSMVDDLTLVVDHRPRTDRPAPYAGAAGRADPSPLWPAWVTACGSWAASPAPDGRQVVLISDRSGLPRAWVVAVDPAGDSPVQDADRELPTGSDHVEAVAWSPDGQWIAVLGAPGGETTRTRVWVVRPDGTDAHRVAGVRSGTASFGPWQRASPAQQGGGAVLPLSTSAARPDETSSTLLDVDSGVRRPLGQGAPFVVLDLSHDACSALVRVGPRGQRTVLRLDLDTGDSLPLAPVGARSEDGGNGATDLAFFLPDGRVLARSNLHRDRFAFVELDPRRRTPRVICVHPGGELDTFAVTDDGTLAALVWNVAGATELELLDLATGRRTRVPGGPELVESVRFSADGSVLVASGQGFLQPRGVWCASTADPAAGLTPVAVSAPLPGQATLVTPTREPVIADDGLRIDGWLYRPPGVYGPAPTVIHLHGGPEAQERPTYNPLFQALAASGVAVYVPNVRGSSGYGRAFEHADDGPLRYAAISDVAAWALHLLRTGVAEHGRLGVMGRSYGGYLTLAALTFHAELFAAGVDVCGMSDLQTFYADTEPWVAAVAASKYGHPVRDAALLADLSPLGRFDRLVAPLLAVHGENDRNVPVNESVQAVRAARDRGIKAELLLFPGEGHEIARPAAKLRFVTAVVAFLTRHLGA